MVTLSYLRTYAADGEVRVWLDDDNGTGVERAAAARNDSASSSLSSSPSLIVLSTSSTDATAADPAAAAAATPAAEEERVSSEEFALLYILAADGLRVARDAQTLASVVLRRAAPPPPPPHPTSPRMRWWRRWHWRRWLHVRNPLIQRDGARRAERVGRCWFLLCTASVVASGTNSN